jgi:hypothetical protein
MVETAVVLVILAAALGIAVVASSYRRFAAIRARLLDRLPDAAPEMTVDGLTDAGFRVRVLGAEVDVDLATLIRRRPRATDEPRWVQDVIDGIRGRIPLPDIPPLALVQDRIVPQLKPSAYVEVFEHYPAGRRMIWRPLTQGVGITYVITGVHQFTAVTDAALDAWRQTPDALHALAVRNLRVQTAHLLAEIGGPRARYEHLDGLDATRILVPDLIAPPGIADPLAAIPEESVLLIAPASAREALAAEAAARYAASTRPLTTALFPLAV